MEASLSRAVMAIVPDCLVVPVAIIWDTAAVLEPVMAETAGLTKFYQPGFFPGYISVLPLALKRPLFF